MELERQAVVPLLVREREQVELRHGPGDAGHGIDPAEGLLRRGDDGGGRLGLPQVAGKDERFRTRRPDCLGCPGQSFRRSCHRRHGAEVVGQADSGRASDATARAGDDGDPFHQARARATASVSIYWRKVAILPSRTVQTWA